MKKKKDMKKKKKRRPTSLCRGASVRSPNDEERRVALSVEM